VGLGHKVLSARQPVGQAVQPVSQAVQWPRVTESPDGPGGPLGPAHHLLPSPTYQWL